MVFSSSRKISLLVVFVALFIGSIAIAMHVPSPAPAAPNNASAPVSANYSGEQPPPQPLVIHAEKDAHTARIIGNILEQNHYLRTPITPEISQRWLKNYFLALDPSHVFFVQSDIDEFTAKYGNSLGDLLLHDDHVTDDEAIAPAFEIFNRYMQRLKEKVGLVEKFANEKFDFTTNETYLIPSDKSNWQPDVTASANQWHSQVKAELLQEVLDKISKDQKKAGADEAKVTTDEMQVKPEMVAKIVKRYHSLYRDNQDYDENDVLEKYINGLCHAYDPHTDYFPPDDAENFKIQTLDLAVIGIGAVLKQEDGYATIEDIVPGGPADMDKRLQKNDRIVAVGQGQAEPVNAVYMRLNKVVDMIRGKQGSVVRLIVIPAGTTDTSVHKEIILTRNKVELKNSRAKADIILHPTADGKMIKIGVLDLHEFYDNTSLDIGKLLVRLRDKEKVDGIILDMRGNGGGLLPEAVNLTGLFVKHEPVVQIRDSVDNIEPLRTNEVRQVWNGPLLAMVSKQSASATEIVAGALQDYGRALIVGDISTHGKGTVQQFPPSQMDFPGTLKMTIAKFYRVSGGSTQEKGVLSDIVLPAVSGILPTEETTLPYYLRYDTISPVPFDYYNEVGAYLPTLQRNSADRVAHSPDFTFVKQDIDFMKKVLDKTVSLNINVRLQEVAEQKAARAKRKAYVDASQKNRDKVLELTLDMVDQGLPAAPPKDDKKKVEDDDDDQDMMSIEGNAIQFDPQLNESVSIMTDYMHALDAAGVKMSSDD